MKTLDELVDIYNRNHARNEDWKLSNFKEQTKSIPEVISDAVFGIEPRLNRDKHQFRIPKKTLKAMTEILEKPIIIEELKKCKSFDDIFAIVYSAKIDGFGPLAVYDTSLRLGVYFGYYPSHIYLHSGALEGAYELLGKDIVEKYSKYFCDNPNYPYISIQIIPNPLNKLEPYHIENFLCINKSRLRAVNKV